MCLVNYGPRELVNLCKYSRYSILFYSEHLQQYRAPIAEKYFRELQLAMYTEELFFCGG
jgi:hypothetical protein